ncbi:uncharacterized protein LOC115629753 [Scaptodrosophila lebanonensis]|uniref:Uncharacterized protein LOC115629753 n=1 Tax=Drosophila lebanonensis TaxID=7225 RepID=A0A6J2U2P2_DROLE|nr:uncharacterized protein LOC115629753 [Scaptodrosophila lebanonensis]
MEQNTPISKEEGDEDTRVPAASDENNENQERDVIGSAAKPIENDKAEIFASQEAEIGANAKPENCVSSTGSELPKAEENENGEAPKEEKMDEGAISENLISSTDSEGTGNEEQPELPQPSGTGSNIEPRPIRIGNHFPPSQEELEVIARVFKEMHEKKAIVKVKRLEH